MSSTTQAADVAGVEVAGPPDGEPIVFVHGVVFTRKMWVPQREDLDDEFRFVAMDLPGHGDRADEDFRLEAALDRLDEVVERVANGSAAVVGLSLGGYVATEYARRHPEKVEALVISGSTANPTGLLETATRVVSAVSDRATQSDLVERGMAWLHAKFTQALDLDPEAEAEILDGGFFPNQVGKAGFELAGRDFRRAFGSYTGPALVLNGKWDLISRLGEEKHARAADDVTVAVVQRAGHVCNLERPGTFATTVRRFVRSGPQELLE